MRMISMQCTIDLLNISNVFLGNESSSLSASEDQQRVKGRERNSIVDRCPLLLVARGVLFKLNPIQPSQYMWFSLNFEKEDPNDTDK